MHHLINIPQIRQLAERTILQTLYRTTYKKNIQLLAFSLLISFFSFAQEKKITAIADSTPVIIEKNSTNAKKDSLVKKHSPRVAAIRSALLPGLGQIYNKKYWKLPIIYGALGTCAGIFTYNLQWYRRTRYAYKVLATNDVSNYPNVHPKLQFLIARNDLNSLQFLRTQYRRDIDYSALVFLILWGLNVVDATVDAHLKGFDVSPDLSLQVKPGHSQMAGTNGVSLVLNIGK